MRIEDEIKLTFDDVLIRPKRSTLISRSEVKLEREFKFRHNKHTWEGIPIFSANMDDVEEKEKKSPRKKRNKNKNNICLSTFLHHFADILVFSLLKLNI